MRTRESILFRNTPQWEGVALREPLHRGKPFISAGECGVLYNDDGERLPRSERLTADNVTLAILTRNRKDFLLRLIDSIERTSQQLPGASRVLHVNNTDDDTVSAVRYHHPNWTVLEYRSEYFTHPSKGIEWIKQHLSYELTDPPEAYNAAAGYVSPNSISWLRNQMVRRCPTPWLISFDDDCEVLPGWFDYYQRMQHASDALAVINNFAFLCMHKEVVRRIGWYDERYVSNHGFEDTDYTLRLNREGVPWVLGFNREHDWRSADQGNPRGSMTGNDRFVHRCALLHSGYSARLPAGRKGFTNDHPFLNAQWHDRKWESSSCGTGSHIDRPPFKGTYFRCKLRDEPQWYPFDDLAIAPIPRDPNLRKILGRGHSPQKDPETTRRSTPRHFMVAPKSSIPQLSIVLTNRDTVPFLTLALKSIRSNFVRGDHQILLFDDASNDGDVEWLKNNQNLYRYDLLLNPGPERVGIVHAYDYCVKSARHDVVFIVHSDMYFGRRADIELYKYLKLGTVVSSTRVEPPIHRGQEQAKILENFGIQVEDFEEERFLDFCETRRSENTEKFTHGLFAPFMCFRADYLRIGGHDPVFAPQSLEDSDLFNRMMLAQYEPVQSWSSLCYHFTCRGSRFRDGVGKNSVEWQRSTQKNRRNFSRKWGRPMPHVDDFCKPIVDAKYNIGLGIDVTHTRVPEVLYSVLQVVEPLFSKVEVLDVDDRRLVREVVGKYTEEESRVTPLLTHDKVEVVSDGFRLADCDVTVITTPKACLSDDFRFLRTLPSWLDRQATTGSVTMGEFEVTIRTLKKGYERENLLIRDPGDVVRRTPEYERIVEIPLAR